MINNKLEKEVELLKILAKGCKKHPAYRAIRKASGRCEECVVVCGKQELNLMLQKRTEKQSLNY